MRGQRRLRPALAAAFLGWWAALGVAHLLALGLGPISVDQPVDGRQVGGWGLRWAWVMAVALASGAALGAPAPAPVRRSAGVMALTALGVMTLCLLAAGLAVAAVRLHLWAQDWGLPSRSGHAARLAVLATAEMVGLPAAALAGWTLFRQRETAGRG